MIIKFTKLIPSAKMPQKSHLHDAGFDLTANEAIHSADMAIYNTNIAVDIPPGFVGLIFMRSSVSKYALDLSNAVGVIDSGYSGPIICKFRVTDQGKRYEPGERIAQIVFLQLPPVLLVECDSVDDFEHTTERGFNGYGSTGK